MAKIEYVHEASNDRPATTETIEVRVWALGGGDKMPFYIGSGFNFQASGNQWLEILYTVEGAQIFYTRNFLHHDSRMTAFEGEDEKRLDELVAKGEGTFGFGDIMPETGIWLKLEKYTYEDENGAEKQSMSCTLKITTDTGVVFGRTSPGERSVDIDLKYVVAEDGIRFMRELAREIDAVQRGSHPDPASFPEGSSHWPFIDQLNRQAYDKISADYQEAYFQNPLLAEAFDGWLAQLPVGAHVLDAGCGHGDPVIGRLLDNGLRVTGSDFSQAMLRRASTAYPRASYIQTATTTLAEQAAFDGICSFNSLLYLDPIDLLNSIRRLHAALKPGGLLFLYAFDSGPDWRGEPLGHRVGQWMWSWHYGMEEAASLLEEHAYFKVLEMRKVQVDEKEAERIAQELEKKKQEEEDYRKRQESDPNRFPFPMPFSSLPIERSPYAYVLIARRNELP